MRVEVSELVAASDIASAAGVSAAAVSNWKVRYRDFPEPVVTVANNHTPLWLRSEVFAWIRERMPAEEREAALRNAQALVRVLS